VSEPNPYRDLKRNPLQEAKVTALLESIKATDLWENIEGRVANGKLQIAYTFLAQSGMADSQTPTILNAKRRPEAFGGITGSIFRLGFSKLIS
jgi:hypothetical protein